MQFPKSTKTSTASKNYESEIKDALFVSNKWVLQSIKI